ncbi:MAG TPA: peptide-methionine (R)-S-oxide reductase MsrB [Mycobacteriales bacterium]|nr:peptide-methionine (R)-S-oxide reductase MsrB [Mycobacteriales bacterium]
MTQDPGPVVKSDDEWRAQLTPQQYAVLRQKATDAPHTGAYTYSHDDGVFRCAGCDAELFRSESKYDSGCGWPSFTAPAADAAVEEHDDTSHGMRRVEVTCRRCGGHLGHVFPDGPGPAGLRYCINSAALRLDPAT